MVGRGVKSNANLDDRDSAASIIVCNLSLGTPLVLTLEASNTNPLWFGESTIPSSRAASAIYTLSTLCVFGRVPERAFLKDCNFLYSFLITCGMSGHASRCVR